MAHVYKNVNWSLSNSPNLYPLKDILTLWNNKNIYKGVLRNTDALIKMQTFQNEVSSYLKEMSSFWTQMSPPPPPQKNAVCTSKDRTQ